MEGISDEYAAGFFDGEGTVYAALRNHPLNISGKSPTIMICITNTVREPLDLLCAKWGGSIYRDKAKTDERQDKYQWTIAAKKAEPFLRAIFPHTIIKKAVIEQALLYCDLMKTPHKERVDYEHMREIGGRLRVSPIVRPEFRRRALEIHGRIRALNIRSKPWHASRRYG